MDRMGDWRTFVPCGGWGGGGGQGRMMWGGVLGKAELMGHQWAAVKKMERYVGW